MKLALAIAIATAALSARADAKGCHETSYVVGFEHCSGFAEWSRDSDVPRLWLDLGFFDHHYESRRFTLGRPELIDEEPSSLRTNARGGVLRLSVALDRHWYVGGEGAIGSATIESGLRGVPPDGGGIYGALHAYAGIHAEVAHVAIAGELAAGLRGEDFTACAAAECNVLEATQGHGEIEARLRAELFLGVHTSVALMFGQSLLDSHDHEIIVSLGVHFRAVDGM